MSAGIFFVGAVMAVGTLIVLDASLPGGLIEASGTLRYAQTMAFTTLTMFQLFNVFNARSDERSAFEGLLRNQWLWGAVGLSFALHVAVVYVPFLQGRVLNHQPEPRGLATVRGSREFSAVAPRAEQAPDPKLNWKTSKLGVVPLTGRRDTDHEPGSRALLCKPDAEFEMRMMGRPW